MRKILTIATVLASMIPAGFAAPSASAQPAGKVVPGPVIPKGAIVVRCCKCLDGSAQEQRVDTGAAAWQVDPPGPPALFQPVVAASNVSWTALPPAKWVGPSGGNQATGDYVYQLQIYIPRCIIPPVVRISGRFAGDNTVRVFQNTTQIAASQGTPDYGFLPGSVTNFAATYSTPGLHTLRFVVTNSGGPTGLAVQAVMSSRCPKQLEHGNAVEIDRDHIDDIRLQQESLP